MVLAKLEASPLTIIRSLRIASPAVIPEATGPCTLIRVLLVVKLLVVEPSPIPVVELSSSSPSSNFKSPKSGIPPSLDSPSDSSESSMPNFLNMYAFSSSEVIPNLPERSC